MWSYLIVAVGGALGSMARYWLGGLVAARLGTGFPYGTFLVNVTGSFLIGYFLTVATERLALPPTYRLLIAVGFLGGYTTFSTFEYETLRLVEGGGLARGLANVVLSVALGFTACWAGTLLGREAPLPKPAAVVEAVQPEEKRPAPAHPAGVSPAQSPADAGAAPE